MKSSRSFWYHLSCLITTLVMPFGLSAGGINLYEISSSDTRLASAGWAARASDPSTLFTNPAGMSRIEDRQLELGLQSIYARVKFHPNSETAIPGPAGDADIWLPSGSFFYVQPINDRVTVGFGNVGYFGADLDYNKNWVGRYYVQETFLQGFSFLPAASYKISDSWSVGLAANVMYGIYHQKNAVSNLLDAQPDGTMKMNDYDWAAGAIVGLLYEPSACTRFGIQYMSPVDLKYHPKVHFDNIGPLLDEIITLRGFKDSKIKIRAKVPQSVMLSAYHDYSDSWSFMGNVGWQEWSKFERASIELADPAQPSLTVIPKYQDTWHIAAGAEYYFTPCFLFSGGIAYDSSAVSNKNRKLNFPVGKQWRFGTGGRWFYSECLAIDLSYELLWSGDLPVNVNRGILAPRVSGKFTNTSTHFVNLNFTYAF